MATRVGALRRIVVAAPAYLKRRGRPKTPRELAGHDTIAFLGMDGMERWRFAGGVEAAIKPRLIVNTAEASIDAAVAGFGITRVLSYQAVDALSGKSLIRTPARSRGRRHSGPCAVSRWPASAAEAPRFSGFAGAAVAGALRENCQGRCMNFASDNTAGIAPEILQALVAGNDGFAMGYGNDDVTRAVEQRIGEIFERDVAVFLVPTGTAANALALAHVSPPWGAVFAHTEAHILTDECGAPEFFGGGLKLVGMPGIGCKVTPETLAETISHYEGHTPHQVVPAAFSFAQASEAGTIYRPDEIAALAEVAHAHGMKVHMDGARFANALVRMNASPAEVTWKAGVDVLSFGATKGGAMAAEAVVFFDRALAANMAERRKRAGHLLSKHRYPGAAVPGVSRQRLLAAARPPRQCHGRPAGLPAGRASAWPPAWPVEANLVFIVLPKAVEARLAPPAPAIMCATATAWRRRLQPDHCLIRLVTSLCHPRGRDRSIRERRRKGAIAAAAAAPQSAAMLAASGRRWREFVKQRIDLPRRWRCWRCPRRPWPKATSRKVTRRRVRPQVTRRACCGPARS